MKCFWCGGELENQKVCPQCGQDMTLYRKIIHASNSCYNLALELGKVRDLSGAIPYLQQSLKWNKNNIEARNLLGLIYCEIGEMEGALEEWTISASYQPKDNPATRYLNVVAARQSRTESINTVIRKYNQAIYYANNDSDDLAVLQARQVIARNSKHLKAHLLLALIYMKKSEYAKAERILRKALKIDAGNTTALRYLNELREIADKKRLKIGKKKSEVTPPQPRDDNTIRDDSILIPTYKETTGSWSTVYLLIVGVLIGGICTYFLIFPSERRSLQAEANQVQQEYFSELNQMQDEIDRLKSGQDDWESQKQALLDELDKYTGQDTADGKYNRLLQVYSYKAVGDDYHAMEELAKINPEGDLSEQFLQCYQELMAEYSTEGVNRIYNYAVEQYHQSQFEVSRDYLLLALEWKPDFPEALYWLGVSYWNLSDQTTAAQYLNQLNDQYPDHGLAAEARRLLDIEQAAAQTAPVEENTQAN